MDRYGVGQQKAIKELNASPHKVSTTGKSTRKKRDTCQHIEEDIVLEVQKMIGFTEAAVPYVPWRLERPSWWLEVTYRKILRCYVLGKLRLVDPGYGF